MNLTCLEYQIIAEKAPNIPHDELRMALNHLTDCQDCRDRCTAQKALRRETVSE